MVYAEAKSKAELELDREKILSWMDSEVTHLCEVHHLNIGVKDDLELMQMTYSILHPESNACYRVAFYREQLVGLEGISKEIYIYRTLLTGIKNLITELGLDRENYTPPNGDL